MNIIHNNRKNIRYESPKEYEMKQKLFENLRNIMRCQKFTLLQLLLEGKF